MIYLDHAATTPLREEVRDAWLDAHARVGNASSVHGAGQQARRVLEDARERLAATLGCEPIETVFTSGGTESVGMAIQGMWRRRPDGARAIVLPDGEHHATLDTVEWLARNDDALIAPVGLTGTGRIPIDEFAAELSRSEVALATALVVGNETGTMNDAPAMARSAADAGVPLHLDAVAAFGHAEVDFGRWRADAAPATGLVAMSISGHKIGAPVGTGALVVSRTASIEALLHGGGQQRGLRAGTQDVAGAVALAVAAELAAAERVAEGERLERLRRDILARLADRCPDIVVLGDPDGHVPSTVHLHLPGAEGESLLFLLDQRGIAVSTGSACQAGVAEPSHVAMAIGLTAREARQVLRVSMGRTTTTADVDQLVDAVAADYPRLVSRR